MTTRTPRNALQLPVTVRYSVTKVPHLSHVRRLDAYACAASCPAHTWFLRRQVVSTGSSRSDLIPDSQGSVWYGYSDGASTRSHQVHHKLPMLHNRTGFFIPRADKQVGDTAAASLHIIASARRTAREFDPWPQCRQGPSHAAHAVLWQ